jgi:hypothetical protein
MCVHQVIDIAFKLMDNKAGNVNGNNLRKKLRCALVASILAHLLDVITKHTALCCIQYWPNVGQQSTKLL